MLLENYCSEVYNWNKKILNTEGKGNILIFNLTETINLHLNESLS